LKKLLIVMLGCCLLLGACGKKGPLIYPELLAPAAPTNITATQNNQVVRLVFNLPQVDQARRTLIDLEGLDVYRRVLKSGTKPECGACTEDFILFRKVFVVAPDGLTKLQGSQAIVTDNEVSAGHDYSYYVIPFNKDAIEGLRSALVVVGVIEPPNSPVLKAVAEPTEIKLAFEHAGTRAANFVGYNLYRSLKGQPFPLFPYARVSAKDSAYNDVGLTRSEMYRYAATAVFKSPLGNFVEGPMSAVVEIKLLDM